MTYIKNLFVHQGHTSEFKNLFVHKRLNLYIHPTLLGSLFHSEGGGEGFSKFSNTVVLILEKLLNLSCSRLPKKGMFVESSLQNGTHNGSSYKDWRPRQADCWIEFYMTSRSSFPSISRSGIITKLDSACLVPISMCSVFEKKHVL